jgi:hypothetical protein
MEGESAMRITVELPEDIARTFAADSRSLSRAAIEALAIEGVRSGKLSTGQARRLLGFNTRMQVDGFLKDHGVYLPLTIENVEREAKLSRRFREQWSSSQTLRP